MQDLLWGNRLTELGCYTFTGRDKHLLVLILASANYRLILAILTSA
jgi:hypothetical protein